MKAVDGLGLGLPAGHVRSTEALDPIPYRSKGPRDYGRQENGRFVSQKVKLKYEAPKTGKNQVS